MKALRAFDIHIYKLAIGEHDYQFQIDEKLFEAFQNEIVRKGDLIAKVSLKKSETMIEMNFQIEGTVELECDRSLDLFDHPLSFEKRMIFKLGDMEQELSEEVQVIQRDAQTINVAALIFEFIGVEIPMKKLHPRFSEEEENDDFVFTSEVDDEKDQEPEADPRWAALEKLKNKNK